MNWYIAVLKKYAEFTGRARRTEFWMYQLFNILIFIGLAIIETTIGMGGGMSGVGILTGLYSLAVLVPGLAVAVRRLHDTDRSGWWLLLLFIPLIGAIVLLVFFILDSSPAENRHGPSPKAVAA
ncbi:MAG: DUF805 domain-containing protein [Steroidobacter sp.]